MAVFLVIIGLVGAKQTRAGSTPHNLFWTLAVVSTAWLMLLVIEPDAWWKGALIVISAPAVLSVGLILYGPSKRRR